MVDTLKFSQMISGGDLSPDQKTAGLLAGGNVLYNNPFPLLAPGSTINRPAIHSSMYYRLRFNTTFEKYEYYSPVTLSWVQIQQSASSINGPFVTYTSDINLPDAFDLGLLSSGILKQTVILGVSTPNIAINEVDYYGPTMTGFLQSPAGIKNSSGETIVTFSSIPSSENYINISSRPFGFAPSISVNGPVADIGIDYFTKGSGSHIFISTSNIPFSIFSGTSSQHMTTFSFSDTPFSRTATFQDSDGTLAYLSDIPSVTPSALSKTDDTNVTVTLGGSPTVSLLAPTSLTLGWTGQLSLSRGGSNANLTASDGGIIYSTATAMSVLSGTATARQMLQSGASGAPSWSTTTYPATNPINTMMYSSADNVLSNISASNSSVLTTDSSGVPSFSGPLSDGQLIIGSTGSNPAVATISPGFGISIVNSAGGIAIANSATGRLKSFQILTSGVGATYTTPAGITSIFVEAIGGGGGGGGAEGAAISFSAAGGGASGGYVSRWFSTVDPTYLYTVGVGGDGGLSGNNNGSVGVTTVFDILRATGGSGGNGSPAILVSSSQIIPGGITPGVGSDGDVNTKGSPGMYGFTITGNLGSGKGGDSMFGGGSPGRTTAGDGNSTGGYGGGGGGGAATTTSFAGGAGTDGLIIVWEFE